MGLPERDGESPMAVDPMRDHGSDAAILARLIRPEDDSLSAPAAEAWLAVRFEQADIDRMNELAARNQDDELTPGERPEPENSRRIGFLLHLRPSRAGRPLKRLQPAG